jgi:predicted NAD/FAD-dependent oxidoreductase
LKIAIIGAGLAGLALAHKLKAINKTVTVFEKSRGVGGRMATRYAEPFQFDHGAQYFTCRDNEFSEFIDSHMKQNHVQNWSGKIVTLNSLNDPAPLESDEKKFIAVPKMNALCKNLSSGLDIRLSVQVQDLNCTDANSWQFRDQNNMLYQGFDWVISTAPAPQTQALFPHDFVDFETLTNVKMTGCYSLMLGYHSAPPLAWDGAFVQNSPIGWICINSRKPERNTEAYSVLVQTSNAWAEAHLEDDQNAVQNLLLKEFQKITDTSHVSPDHLALHRWRYAGVESAAVKDFLIDPRLKLAACGDWCIEGRVEAAFQSASALVAELERTSF